MWNKHFLGRSENPRLDWFSFVGIIMMDANARHFLNDGKDFTPGDVMFSHKEALATGEPSTNFKIFVPKIMTREQEMQK